MIKDPPIVEDIRRIRCALSEQFGHDVEKYIDYLQRKYEPSGQVDMVEPPPESSPDTTKGNQHED